MSDKNINTIIKILQNAHNMMTNRSWVNDDIFEHLPTLYKYAKECSSIIECGTRNCVSSYPLIKGLLENPSKEKKMVSIDLNKSEGMKAFEALAKELIDFSFFEGSDLIYPIKGTYDMVFIDTIHIRAQLIRELRKYSPHTAKYIIMHDSEIDRFIGECIRNGWDYVKISKENGFEVKETMEGLWPAIMDFLEENKDWVIKEHFKNNNGLTILERVNPLIPEIKEEAKFEPKIDEISPIIKYSEIKKSQRSSIKNIEGITQVMRQNNCKDICILILGGLASVFTEITSVLQRQIIDAGVLCKILDKSESANPETLYLLFNAHQYSEPIAEGLKYAIFNYEQGGSSYIKYPSYLEKMKGGVAIFDYSDYNRHVLENLTGKEVIIVPFSYHHSLTVLEPNTKNDEEIDVLFYGLMNANRQLYVDILKHTGYKVKFVTDYNLFGDALIEELKKAKIVLNLHYYTNPSVLELSRVVPLIANHKLVFSETSNDTLADSRFFKMVVYITPDTIVEKLKEYLENPDLRFQKVAKAFEILSSEV